MRLAKAVLAIIVPAIGLMAQPAPLMRPLELDHLVQRIALYPDSLLAQILTASTYYDQIPDAAAWAMDHRNLHGPVLADAISGARLPWDPAVQALLPVPTVLDMMARDMQWTSRLGTAFLAQPTSVMDAAQRDRRIAYEYGYLRSNPQFVVNNGAFIEIVPAAPGFLYVPVYSPAVVFVRPRPGFFVGGAITAGFGVSVGAWLRPWGWGATSFGWREHAVFVNSAPWGRTWANRETYVHPSTSQRGVPPAPQAVKPNYARPATKNPPKKKTEHP